MTVRNVIRRAAFSWLIALASGWTVIMSYHRLADPVQYRIWREMETVDSPAWYWEVYKWIARPIHVLYGSVKVTHPYHWLPPQPMRLQEDWILQIEGDPEARARTDNPISEALASLTWKNGVVIAPSDSTKPWQYAWAYKQGDEYIVQICTIICQGPQFVFVGPGDVTMIAFDLQGRQVPLRQVSPGHLVRRDDRRYHDLRKL